MKLPALYKRTKTGAVQFWEISSEGNQLITVYGQLGTDSPQRTVDIIREGKNQGRANATTAEEQAEKEAKARWEKQIKKGYVENKDSAERGENDLGGVAPMLAQSYAKHAAKIQFPAAIQPKLDGVRCLAVLQNGTVTLWSRTRKPITGVPHIQTALETLSKELKGTIVLDGELYSHEDREDFEGLISVVRQQKQVAEDAAKVQYHIYDSAIFGVPFIQRLGLVVGITTMEEAIASGCLKAVATTIVDNEQDAIEAFEKFRDQGYEGAMLRNLKSEYESSRSYNLQKVKEFVEEEFPIVGISEGRGKLAGHAATFVCTTKEGAQFEAKMMGSLDYLKQCFENHSLWKGKKLTVKFQKWSGTNKVPIFPVGKAIRDYE